MSTRSFNRLKNHVAKQYEKKGIPKEKAERWGAGTAEKVKEEKEEKEV